MKDKKIAVCLKYYNGEINPFDASSLECALLTGASVTVVTMSPPRFMPAAKSLTRLGAEVVFISDPIYAGSDTIATSYILSEAISRLNPDFVFMGRQSVDGDTGQVPPMMAKRLGFGIVAKVMETDEEGVKTRSGETHPWEQKTVYTFEKIKTLRFPSIFSREKDITLLTNAELGLSPDFCGLEGSPTRVVRSYESEVGRRKCEFVGLSRLDELIKEGLNAQKASYKSINTQKIEKILYVGGIKEVAEGVAETAERLDVDGLTAEEISEAIVKSGVKAVLWSDDEKNLIVAPQVAVLSGAGICADCIDFRVENAELIMTRPALGGAVTADIKCRGLAFATVRTLKKSAEVIFSVGKGALGRIEDIKALAESYGAEVCCTRAVADGGYLPYEAQVGLTGKMVSPKVYVAFGISGAVQHICGITGSGMVIAINNDKQALIFDYADYGIEEDINNVEL